MEDRRTLILLRHGKSDWSGGEPDSERPLAARGRRQAAEAGRWLAGHVDDLDLAVVSPAERARSTWAIASGELAAPPRVELEDRVYAASGGTLLDVVRSLSDELRTVVLVGHNPGLEDLAARLTGEWVEMPTSALALVDVTGPWAAAGPSTAEVRLAGRPPA
jgi:phosphohistidine phosphatase